MNDIEVVFSNVYVRASQTFTIIESANPEI